MMKKHAFLWIILSFVVLTLNAQDNAKYLKGTVPEENGRVVFSKTIRPTQSLSENELFDKINLWAQDNYKGNDADNRILLNNADKKQIACSGKVDLVFGRKLLSLDIAPMSYQLIMGVEDGECNVKIRGISYEYNSGRDNDKLSAEEMITDKIAVNKKGDKLNNYYGKFRTATIDSVNAIFESIENSINGLTSKGQQQVQYIYIDKNTGAEVANPVSNTPAVVAAVPISVPESTQIIPVQVNGDVTATLSGFKNVAPENIPGNIIKLLNDWTLITSGSGDNVNVMTASWGGLGVLWGKPISTCFINPTRYSITTMDEGETYTISFYTAAYKDILKYCGSNSGRNTDKIKGSGLTPIKTPSGATAFSEAWMIFECRKMVAQPISDAAVKMDKSELSEDWTKNGYHKMYIGEILNVWVK